MHSWDCQGECMPLYPNMEWAPKLAVAAMQAAEFIGLPEARIPLAQATTYLASAPKSNAAYLAINMAMSDLEKEDVQLVPDHLRSGKKIKPSDQSYKYPHDHENHYIEPIGYGATPCGRSA